MNLYVTEIRAIDPITGEMKTWAGPNVEGISMGDAENNCQSNGLGYCKVIGQLVAEIPTKSDSLTPDWDKMVDYEKPSLN